MTDALSENAPVFAELQRIRNELGEATGIDFEHSRAKTLLRVPAWFGLIDFFRQAERAVLLIERSVVGIIEAYERGVVENGQARAIQFRNVSVQQHQRCAEMLKLVTVPSPASMTEPVLQTLEALDELYRMTTLNALNLLPNAEQAGIPREIEQALTSMREVAGWIKQAEFETTARESTQRRVAADQIASAFLNQSRVENRSANRLRGAALLVAAASFGIAAYFAVRDLDASLASHAGRTLTALPLLLIAAYLASESHDHRRIARRAQYWAVLLQTMDSFTAELEIEDRRVIVLQLASGLFRAPSESGENAAAPLGMDVLPQLTTLIEALKGPSSP